MEAMRKSWTDERLDDGFDRVDADLRAVRAEVSAFRVETNERFDRLEGRANSHDGRFDRLEDRFSTFEERFDRLEDRFDGWQRGQLQVGGGVIVALLGILVTQL
jgi:predicted nuclease with TOPRIM domain